MSEKPPRIVAELGRPETPQETADRKAAASATRRSNQTAVNLVIALVASLAIVAFLILVVVRPDQSQRDPVDYTGIAAEAQRDADAELAVPKLGDDWSANRAEYSARPSDEVPRWEIGFITPKTQYIALTQGIGASTSWVDTRLDSARPTGQDEFGGVEWTVYDRRSADDPGNFAFSLVREFGDSTVILNGTASDEEFDTVATAIVTQLGDAS